MSEIRTKALCLKSIDIAESDKLVTLATIEHGKITAKLKGCRNPKAKLRYASAPFCFGEYILNVKHEYYQIINCTEIESFVHIVENIESTFAATCICEFIDKATQENDETDRLVLLAVRTLQKLNVRENALPALIDFMTEGFNIIGYEFDSTRGRGARAPVHTPPFPLCCQDLLISLNEYFVEITGKKLNSLVQLFNIMYNV